MTRHFNQQPATAGRLRRRCAGLGAVCRVWLLIWAVNLSLVAGISTAGAEEEMPADFQVKAAFLVNFPKYVDWPANIFAETNSPITVAIFGDDNVANEVQNMIGSGRIIAVIHWCSSALPGRKRSTMTARFCLLAPQSGSGFPPSSKKFGAKKF